MTRRACVNPNQRHPWGRLGTMAAPYARIISALSAYEPERLQEVRRFLPAGLGHLDVLVYTPDELAEMQQRGNAFSELIMDEAQLIYGR